MTETRKQEIVKLSFRFFWIVDNYFIKMKGEGVRERIFFEDDKSQTPTHCGKC